MNKTANTKVQILKFLKHPLVSGGAVMVIGTNIHNAGQLLYHFMAIRMLNEAHYGDLAAIISIFGLLAIIQQSLGLAVVKFIASEKDYEDASNMARWIFLWSICFAGGLGVLIFFLSPFLSHFLQIGQPTAVFLFAPVVIAAFISNTGRSLLQGFTKFAALSGSMIVEVSLKIVLTGTLIYLGYELFGAMIGLLLSASTGLAVVYFSLKKRLSGKRKPMPRIVPLLKYSLPVLMQSLAVTSMYSTDILLVKHFFSPETAGAYAALAKFGTIALFAAAPITHVMFPLVAKKHSRGEDYVATFYLSLIFVVALSAAIVGLYALFGSTIADILTSGKYTAKAYLLWRFGLYMLLLGVAMLFSQFYLSIGKTKITILIAAAAISQVILILLFHSTLVDVIHMSIIAAALLVLGLSLYFPHHNRKE